MADKNPLFSQSIWGNTISLDDEVWLRGFPNKGSGKVTYILEDNKVGQTWYTIEWKDGTITKEYSEELTTIPPDERGFFKPKDNQEDLDNKAKYDKERMKAVDKWKSPKKKEQTERLLWASKQYPELEDGQIDYVRLLLATKGKDIPDDSKFYDGGNGLAIIASGNKEILVKIDNENISDISYFIEGRKVNAYQYNTYRAEEDNRMIISKREDGEYNIKWGSIETIEGEDYVEAFIVSNNLDWDNIKERLDAETEIVLGEG